jgi:hypothetical protein
MGITTANCYVAPYSRGSSWEVSVDESRLPAILQTIEASGVFTVTLDYNPLAPSVEDVSEYGQQQAKHVAFTCMLANTSDDVIENGGRYYQAFVTANYLRPLVDQAVVSQIFLVGVTQLALKTSALLNPFRVVTLRSDYASPS